jgi:hypothetical protein
VKCFVNLVLSTCVEGNFVTHLKDTITWADNIDFSHGEINFMANLKKNHPTMIRVCHSGDLKLVKLFYKRKFYVKSTLEDFNHETEELEDLIKELYRLQAVAQPAYMIAKHQYDHDFDPMNEVFRLLKVCRDLAASSKEVSNKVDNIASTLGKFAVRILDQCHVWADVEMLLDQVDEVEELAISDCTLRPRIYLALHLNLKDFIVHDNCQMVVRRTFYDDSKFCFLPMGSLAAIRLFVRQFFLTPLYALFYIFSNARCGGKTRTPRAAAGNGEDGNDNRPKSCKNWHKELSRNFTIPVNCLVSQVSCYILFLVWIFLTVFDPMPHVPWYKFLSCVYAVGYIVADLELMIQLSQTVTTGSSTFYKHWRKMVKFLSNKFLDYRILSHIIFMTGVFWELVGRYTEWFPRDGELQNCVVTDLKSYSDVKMPAVKVGINLQGIAVIMIMTHMLQFLRLVPALGAVYVAINKCVRIVSSFVFTYLIVTLAFTFGVYFILRYSTEVCDGKGYTKEYFCKNKSDDIQPFQYTSKVMTINCTINGKFAKCQEDCIGNFIENSSVITAWQVQCGDIPKIHFELEGSRVGSFGLPEHKSNNFYNFRNSIKTSFFHLFDPGHPEVVGCSGGAARNVGLVLWFAYNVIITVVLLNLLISLMNVTIIARDDTTELWKYHRTHVWMDYCNESVVLPSPLNLVDWVVRQCCQRCCQRKQQERQASERKQNLEQSAEYMALIKRLVAKYTIAYLKPKSAESNEGEHAQRLITKIRKMCENNRDNTKRRLTNAAREVEKKS